MKKKIFVVYTVIDFCTGPVFEFQETAVVNRNKKNRAKLAAIIACTTMMTTGQHDNNIKRYHNKYSVDTVYAAQAV